MSLPRPHNPLAIKFRELRLTKIDLAHAAGMSGSGVEPYFKPLSHPQYRVPPLRVWKIIYCMTDGQVTPEMGYPVKNWKRELDAKLLHDADVSKLEAAE